MKSPGIYFALLASLLSAATLYADDGSSNVLLNPSFENDDGLFPWLSGSNVQVELVDEGADGIRSVTAASGYGVLRQRVELGDLSGRRATLRLYAKGEEGAQLGVMLVYQRPDAKRGGAPMGTNTQVIWNRPLSGDWQEYSSTIRFAEGASGPVSVHLFRSNKEGRIWFDNVSLVIEGEGDSASEEAAASSVGEGANLLKNSGFDEDEGQIGFPDFWKQEGAATVKSAIPQGQSRYLQIEGASGGVSQALELSNLEKRKLAFHGRFRGEGTEWEAWIEGNLSGGTPFRIKIADGVQVHDQWRDLKRSIALNVKGKIETAQLVMKKREGGALYLEDISLSVVGLSAKDTLSMVHEKREWEYLRAQVQGSALPAERIEAIDQEISEVIDVIDKIDRDGLLRIPEFGSRREQLGVEVWQAAAEGKTLLAKSALPYERLDPALSPKVYQSSAVDGEKVIGLLGWETPVGFIVTNPQGKDATYSFRILVNGAPGVATVRRQYFLDTWYTRGRVRMADPMIKAAPPKERAGNGETGERLFSFSLKPVETAQFYVEAEGLKAGNNEVVVEIFDGAKAVARLPFTVIQHDAPIDEKTLATHDYKAFLYLGHPSASHHPDLFLDSLVKLGATAFEWELMPRPKFDDEGKVASLDFHHIDAWLERVAKTPLRPALFWEARVRHWKTPSGRPLSQLSPEWKEAYGKVHEAFFEHAAKYGMGKDRFIALVKDEPHSQDYANRPDPRIQNAVGLLQSFREFYPEEEVMVTLTDYAFYEDIQAILPYPNVVLPLWPYRDTVLRFSPEGLNARTEFIKRIYPLLKEEREKRGLKIWSYAIAGGKQSDVTAYHLAYPLMGARMGMTGSSHWAYSLSNESSWDDTDGNGVDYSMIYMGSESAPENIEWNTTREAIVPSIRWLALRQGLRDARLYATLEAAMKSRPEDDELKARFERFLVKLDRAAGPSGYGEALEGWKRHYRLPAEEGDVSEEAYWQLRQELVEIYAQWAAHQ